jgi:1-acyl-sn-glycerol-3-phosphate acyltransferase
MNSIQSSTIDRAGDRSGERGETPAKIHRLAKKKHIRHDAEPGLHPGSSQLVRRSLDWFGRLYSKLFYKAEAYGLENIPTDGSVLVLAKHQRVDDIPLGLANALFRRRWNVWCVMKDSLAHPIFFNYFLKCGGIPLNRDEPRKSKKHLLHGRKVLHQGNMLVIFPEQTTVPYAMGRGRAGAFRFVAGKPEKPLPVLCLGMEYQPRGWFRRTKYVVRAGELKHFTADHDPEQFLHECMHEIASLTNLTYPFEKGEPSV